MSPHVANFVHDLVAMAKAMEENPVLQDQIEALKAQLAAAQDHNAGLEVNIISYKQQIDDLQAKVRQAEVARDDAEFRFLELDEKSHTVLGDIESILTLANAAKLILNPPKPEPVKEPEPIRESIPFLVTEPGPDLEHVQAEQTVTSFLYPASPPDATQGQSETTPMEPSLTQVGGTDTGQAGVESETIQSQTAPSTNVESLTGVSTESKPEATPADVDPEPEPRWSYEWYQWNDRKNEREAKRAYGF